MQFLNWNGEEVQRVAFNFDYKGYNISVSNCTPRCYVEVMVFNDSKGIATPFPTVEAAIIGIDKLI